VDLRTLKNKLREYVRLAASGETVLVTDGDRMVAELGPPREGSPLQADALLAKGLRTGWIAPPALPSGGPAPRKPVAELRELLEDLRQDRDAR
jgi:antitoxin (DNA-binding transcriptional repressor) of toxin-antitoxin stability system